MSSDRLVNSPPLLSTKQAARLLGIHFNTLCKWRITGSGPSYVKIGRAVRYRPSVIESWLQQNTRQHTA